MLSRGCRRLLRCSVSASASPTSALHCSSSSAAVRRFMLPLPGAALPAASAAFAAFALVRPRFAGAAWGGSVRRGASAAAVRGAQASSSRAAVRQPLSASWVETCRATCAGKKPTPDNHVLKGMQDKDCAIAASQPQPEQMSSSFISLSVQCIGTMHPSSKQSQAMVLQIRNNSCCEYV